MKMSTTFLKICKLAGADPTKVLEEYNKTTRVRGASTVNYVPLKGYIVPKDYKGYLYVNDDGVLHTIPSEIIRKADGKRCVFHTAYQAVQTKKTPPAPPAPPEKTAPKNRHQRRAEKAQKKLIKS